MSVRVLVSEHPHRSLALATDEHVLLFKHTHISSLLSPQDLNPANLPLPRVARKEDASRCIAEFTARTSLDLKSYRTLTTAKGTLGLITLNNDVFICVVTGSTEVATVRPEETVQRIIAVEFYCLNRSEYDHGHLTGPNPYPGQSFQSDDMAYGSGNEQNDTTAEHPFHALKKLLSGGNFYYSLNFDLTRRLQDRIGNHETVDVDSIDEGLLWNSYMIHPLLSFRNRLSSHERLALDRSGILTSVMRGFAQTLTIPPSSSPIRRKVSNYPALLTVISRLSARRAGTRFNARGLDDDGNVANFVETETIFWSPTGICFSYVQIRGSVPVFWESSSSLIPGQQKIQITRSSEATQPSFDKHFKRLEKNYGAIHIVNLLSETKPGEVELSMRYQHHINQSLLKGRGVEGKSDRDLMQATEFDFHEHARSSGVSEGAKELRPYIEESAERFVYFLCEDIGEDAAIDKRGNKMHRPAVIMQQTGVFRVNCLDCLDRTNLVQGLLSQMVLEHFLDHRGERGSSVFWLRHSSLWADNGDALSKIYAGTGALKSSFTRHGKVSLGGLMADARKSAARLYVNHFEDKDRQNTVDLLLGKLVGQDEIELFDPVNDWVLNELAKRKDEYESLESMNVWVGTYNLNGRVMSDISELRRWLPESRPGEVGGFDILAIAFQEIVELSPQQIMSTDPGRRLVWENAVKQCLNDSASSNDPTSEDYVLLRSGQLVGAALMIFVRESVLTRIQNVEGAIKKTGMSGMAGNKGAVAIRMDIDGSSVCFVTAHLAAGFSNYEERNRDYLTISSGLRFQRDRSIEDHDVVIWAGDFNYRIGLSHERARNLIAMAQKGITYPTVFGPATVSKGAEEVLGQLYENDQLNIQMVVGHVFKFYQEGKVRFLPTYKFDLGQDNYDSSEKARIPAWTDRILWRTKPGTGQIRQLDYTSVMHVRFSDHKPLFATFEVTIRKIDKVKKATVVDGLYEKRKRDIRNRSTSETNSTEDPVTGSEDSDEDAEDLMGYQSIQEGLPPASSDRRKWWLDGDRPTQSELQPPGANMVLNERRAGNPWRENGEEDWVEVEPSVSMSGNGSSESKSFKPQPPPPRKGQRKVPTPSAEDGPNKYQEQELPTVSPMTSSFTDRNPPLPPPPRRPVPSSSYQGGLSRSASVASTATTATMMTARSSFSIQDGKKPPPPKPSKPASLTARSIIEGVSGDGSSSPQRVEGECDQDTPPPLPRRTNTSQSIASTATVRQDGAANLPTRKALPNAVPPSVARSQQPVEEHSRSDGVPSTVASSNVVGKVRKEVHSPKPPLPPRGMNMMDDDPAGDQNLEAWKTLTPKR